MYIHHQVDQTAPGAGAEIQLGTDIREQRRSHGMLESTSTLSDLGEFVLAD